jgi:TatD DNase family protein
MNFPEPCDYIDIHNHGSNPDSGIFTVETLMAHEKRMPENVKGLTYCFGIHPWHLNEKNHDELLRLVILNAVNPDVAAIGEAGFDKIKGPPQELQVKTFEEQVLISEEKKKPMIIHCVRAWDDLLREHKKLRPKMAWLVHGFRGKPDLAQQLVSKGMFLSFWFDYVMRPEAVPLLKSVPKERIFLETDGAEIDIRDIYKKVSVDLGLTVEELKTIIYKNFNVFFRPQIPTKRDL